MTLRDRRATKVGVIAASLALAASACGGGDGAGTDEQQEGPTGNKGGTLFLINDADFEHIDPQRTYVANALNFTERFMTRTLTTFKSVRGPAGSEIVPDMATDLGKPSEGNKVWTFKLKDNIKFDDGTPVTCKDLKYGISRSFAADVITDGPHYAQHYLDVEKDAEGTPVYMGPYTPGPNGGFDKAIECTDDKTIVFRLAEARGDFNYTVTLPQFAAVPQAKDTKAQYDNNVVANGPYKIESYQRNKQLTLVRNTHWDPKTDTVRKAFPDRVVVRMGADPNVIDQQLLSDTGDAKTGVMNSTNVQPQNLNRVLNDPALKRRSVHGLDGFTLYIAVNTQKVKEQQVRLAIGTAVNKETYRGALGGKDAGDYATSFISPALKSHKKFDVYNVPPTGDPAKAKQMLQQAGVTTPYKLRFDYRNRPATAKAAAAVKEALEREGNFAVTLNAIPSATYYTTIGKKATAGDIMTAGWGPDWPSGSSVIPPLFHGPLALAEGTPNYSQLKDPKIDQMIEEANKETDLDKQAKLWGELDEAVVKTGAAIPTIWSKTTQMTGSGVKGAFLHAFYGEIDLNALSVA